MKVNTIYPSIPSVELLSFIAVDSGRDIIYTASMNGYSIYEINLMKNSIHSIIHIRGPIGLSFNDRTGKIYVGNIYNGILWELDSNNNYTKSTFVVNNFPLGISINPKTNLVYVTNSELDTITVLDPNTHAIFSQIPVGKNPIAVTINYNRDLIYVVNDGSNTVSVIDSKTHNLTITAIFSVSPQNSGHIICTDREISTNVYVRIMPNIKCKAESNNGFQFTNWIENLGLNSSRHITAPTTPDNLFTTILNALGISPNDNAAVLSVSKYGSYSAVFEKVPPPIPQEYLVGLYTVAATVFYGLARPKYCTLDKF